MDKQRLYHQQKLEKLLVGLPSYIIDYFDSYMEILSPLTLCRYAEVYHSFLSWLIQEHLTTVNIIEQIDTVTLEHLSKKDVENYFKYLSRQYIGNTVQQRRRSDTTINNYKSALRALFKFLTVDSETDDGSPYFDRNVMSKITVRRIKETFSKRSRRMSEKIFTDNDDIDFLNYIKNDYEQTLSGKQLSYFLRDKARDIAILTLFLRSGIRVNELSNLTLDNIDYVNEEISVIRKGNRPDVVIISHQAIEMLENYIAVREQQYKVSATNPYVFVSKSTAQKNQPLSIRAIQNIVKKYTSAYNIPMSPHKLRHSYGTKLAERTNGNVPLIMAQLGHATSETSLLYINEGKKKIKEATQSIDDKEASE